MYFFSLPEPVTVPSTSLARAIHICAMLGSHGCSKDSRNDIFSLLYISVLGGLKEEKECVQDTGRCAGMLVKNQKDNDARKCSMNQKPRIPADKASSVYHPRSPPH